MFKCLNVNVMTELYIQDIYDLFEKRLSKALEIVWILMLIKYKKLYS